MTLLEFIATRYIGPASHNREDGQSTWPCPACAHRSFHTLPHRPEYKDRFKCWSCAYRGDVFDLLRHFHPREHFGELKARCADLEREYGREGAANPTPSLPDHTAHGAHGLHTPDTAHGLRTPVFPSSPRGGGRPSREDDPARIERAFHDLDADEVALLARAVMLAKRARVSVEGLAYFAFHAVREAKRDMARHLAECDDAECWAACCRARRGLPPLTVEERRAGLEARKRERDKAREAREAEAARQIERALRRLKAPPSRNGKGARHGRR